MTARTLASRDVYADHNHKLAGLQPHADGLAPEAPVCPWGWRGFSPHPHEPWVRFGSIVFALATGACSPAVALGNASLAADMTSTYAVSDHGRWDQGHHESNVILGPTPGALRLSSYGAGCIAINTIVAGALPRWAAIPTEIVLSGIELRLAVRNVDLFGVGN